jgi:uncharacterized protein (TIGR01244 family)
MRLLSNLAPNIAFPQPEQLMHAPRWVVVAVALTPALTFAQQFTGSHQVATIPAPLIIERDGKIFQAVEARVGDDLFISGQPTEAGIRSLHDQGVTTIVNLRTPPEMQHVPFDEAALASQLGMTYVYLPVRGNDEFPYAPATVDKFADALRQAKGKVLLHCTVAWRASHLWAAYLIAKRGVSVDSALANARAINLMDDHHPAGGGKMPVEEFLGRSLQRAGGPQ